MGEGVASLYIFYLVKYGWQAVFLNIGSLGMLLAASIFFFIKEPKRMNKIVVQSEVKDGESIDG